MSVNLAVGVAGVLLGIAGLWLAYRGHRDLRVNGYTEFARDLIKELDSLDRAAFELADIAGAGAGATDQQLAALEDEFEGALMRAMTDAEEEESPEYVRNLIRRIPLLTRNNASPERRREVARLVSDARSVLLKLTDAKLWWRDARSYRRHGSAHPKDRPSRRWKLRRDRMRRHLEELSSKVRGPAS